MIKTFFRITCLNFILASLLVMGASLLGLNGVAYAEDPLPVSSKQAVCEGAGITEPGLPGCSTPTSGTDTAVEKALKTGLNIFSVICGIIAVVMMIIAGLKYMTSGGDSGKVASAQNTVLYAAIGIVVVVLAQVMVKFVIGKFST